ncbi:hypothetical protein C3K47_05380 [Solitalea longa]|uniref:Endonuclease/exonuclease/phosphatase domain-containing protein n=1 Tax=Solitalea longa TaxID=2079460 RepID=A0A2S5A609_9SPHI|nr:endonuclease/exonuclease/phosphatase family protein [Solitalea longa]POY37956.1 hypothetical protein C3K47_05380 [Solitalea longa]
MKTRIATFNVENLFNRYAFLDQPWDERNYENFIQAVGLVSIAGRDGSLVAYSTTNIQRNNTAQAILDIEPDILAVQEIENIETLRIFNNEFLDDYFDRIIVIEGNDPRGIDLGLMIKNNFPCEVLNIRTHVDDGVTKRQTVVNFGYKVRGSVFSRDCLEVDIKVGNSQLCLLVNHLKAQDQTPNSKERRKKQAEKVAEYVTRIVADGKSPIVLGDLNTDILRNHNDDSLQSLNDHPNLTEPFLAEAIPLDWCSHYYTSGKKISKLDYIFVHKDLETAIVDKGIWRKGLTLKCKQYTGDRYPTIGLEHTEASDHCPVWVELDL